MYCLFFEVVSMTINKNNNESFKKKSNYLPILLSHDNIMSSVKRYYGYYGIGKKRSSAILKRQRASNLSQQSTIITIIHPSALKHLPIGVMILVRNHLR